MGLKERSRDGEFPFTVGWDAGISERVKGSPRASVLTGYLGYLTRTVGVARYQPELQCREHRLCTRYTEGISGYNSHSLRQLLERDHSSLSDQLFALLIQSEVHTPGPCICDRSGICWTERYLDSISCLFKRARGHRKSNGKHSTKPRKTRAGRTCQVAGIPHAPVVGFAETLTVLVS
jgi:hypothetical protein